MASRAFDDMNEFFDFDQLDDDHGAQAVASPERQHVDPFDGLGEVMTMDWAINDPMPVPTLDVLLPCEIETSNNFSHVSSPDHYQWPSVEMPCSSSREEDTGIDPFQCRDVDPAPCQYASSITAPLSSLSALEGRQHVTGADKIIDTSEVVRKTFLPAPEVPILEITAPLASENASRGRPTVPLPQASVTSWTNRKPASAKRKGPHSRIPLEAKQILEDEFTANPYPCSWEMDIIAHQANLDVKKVRNWFNNTRARQKGGGGFFLLVLSRSYCSLIS
jgi:hypothetical protein